jgi:hypothetical protein
MSGCFGILDLQNTFVHDGQCYLRIGRGFNPDRLFCFRTRFFDCGNRNRQFAVRIFDHQLA